MPRESNRRRVCFVTGTRTEFGLMASTLRALRDDPRIELQLIATGMHTQRSRGSTLREIRQAGWAVDAVVPWKDDLSPSGIAAELGRATARLAGALERLAPEVVLVVGDRVEAMAAATAAHVGGRVLAHVHGGDRAMGQVDDALRHAISKLAHVHFAATRASGDRLFAMGEDRWRIRVVGAPGIDGIRRDADAPRTSGVQLPDGEFVLAVLHPTDADDAAEARRVASLQAAIRRYWSGAIVALLPNNDPGSAGIALALRRLAQGKESTLFDHAERPAFLAMLRDCRLLVGNSSSGIIEAGSFSTTVVDVGPRQAGRERGSNVVHAEWSRRALDAAIAKALAMPRRRPADNPYDRGGAAKRIVDALAALKIDAHLRRKLIRY